MPFESIRWGVPNVAAVIAMIAMPLISLAIPDERRAAPVQIEDAEFEVLTTVDARLTAAE